MQTFRVRVMDRRHPATSFWPADEWEWTDEFYYVREQNPDVRVLLAGVQASLARPGKPPADLKDMPEPYPLAWCHEWEGIRSFYTALGHSITPIRGSAGTSWGASVGRRGWDPDGCRGRADQIRPSRIKRRRSASRSSAPRSAGRARCGWSST